MSHTDVFRVVQLSDTHFLETGEAPEGGFAYDTAAAFEAVRTAIAERERPDLVVVTGDVADHGRAEQYRQAGMRSPRSMRRSTSVPATTTATPPSSPRSDAPRCRPLAPSRPTTGAICSSTATPAS